MKRLLAAFLAKYSSWRLIFFFIKVRFSMTFINNMKGWWLPWAKSLFGQHFWDMVITETVSRNTTTCGHQVWNKLIKLITMAITSPLLCGFAVKTLKSILLSNINYIVTMATFTNLFFKCMRFSNCQILHALGHEIPDTYYKLWSLLQLSQMPSLIIWNSIMNILIIKR